MKIVFINVVLEGDYQYEQEIPLGIASLMAFLRKHNYDVICQQCFAGRDDAQISLATRIEADIYCFQLNTVNYQAVKTVVKEIKIKRPTSYAIFGGPFLISLSEKILKNEPLYDFIVFGEGEATLLELLRAIERPKSDFSNINGLVWRKESGEVVTNKPRELIEDLDTLPFPARDFLEDGKLDPRDNGLIESVRLVSSRGCIGRCSFCCVNLYNKFQKGRAWRGRSPKNVVDEIEYLSKTFNAKLFNFSDSSFDDPGKLGKIRSRQICEEIISRKIPFSAKIYLRCETMKSSDDIELLKLYKKAGIDIIIIGAESGSDYELKLYDKPAGVEDNYRTVRILEDLGLFYVMSGFIMFGPNSTLETLRSNIEFLYRAGLAENIIPVGNALMLIRDSKLYNMLLEEGRVVEPENYWELPKYTMKDFRAERMTKHWQNMLIRYPYTNEVSKFQINIGNLVSRMTNPTNYKVLGALNKEFVEFKDAYARLNKELRQLQYEYFLYTLEQVGQDCPDEVLSVSANKFFVQTYKEYSLLYKNLFDGFLEDIVKSGFGLSSLIFKHFASALTKKVPLERIGRK